MHTRIMQAMLMLMQVRLGTDSRSDGLGIEHHAPFGGHGGITQRRFPQSRCTVSVQAERCFFGEWWGRRYVVVKGVTRRWCGLRTGVSRLPEVQGAWRSNRWPAPRGDRSGGNTGGFRGRRYSEESLRRAPQSQGFRAKSATEA